MNITNLNEMLEVLNERLMVDIMKMIDGTTTATELRVVLQEIPKFKDDGMISDDDILFLQKYVVNHATKQGLIK